MGSGGTCHYCRSYHCECVVSSNEPVKKSTPITPDGLRGLGLTEEPQAHGCKARIDLYSNDDEAIWIQLVVYNWGVGGGWFAAVIKQDGEDDELDNFDEVCIGYPTDLETVERLIDVLRAMNGGG